MQGVQSIYVISLAVILTSVSLFWYMFGSSHYGLMKTMTEKCLLRLAAIAPILLMAVAGHFWTTQLYANIIIFFVVAMSYFLGFQEI